MGAEDIRRLTRREVLQVLLFSGASVTAGAAITLAPSPMGEIERVKNGIELFGSRYRLDRVGLKLVVTTKPWSTEAVSAVDALGNHPELADNLRKIFRLGGFLQTSVIQVCVDSDLSGDPFLLGADKIVDFAGDFEKAGMLVHEAEIPAADVGIIERLEDYGETVGVDYQIPTHGQRVSRRGFLGLLKPQNNWMSGEYTSEGEYIKVGCKIAVDTTDYRYDSGQIEELFYSRQDQFTTVVKNLNRGMCFFAQAAVLQVQGRPDYTDSEFAGMVDRMAFIMTKLKGKIKENFGEHIQSPERVG
jgi:hypothetical protein